jgi:NMD protein affecting ribosome stability and mRNA decay
MSMMICPNCGYQPRITAELCSKCGRDLREQVVEIQAVELKEQSHDGK